MEYVVPLVIVLVVVIVVIVVTRFVGRRDRTEAPLEAGATPGTISKPATSSRRGKAITREAAEAASGRLTPEQHRTIYSLIAQNQVLTAVQVYRKATRLGLAESAGAIAALAQFPQPSPEPATPAVADTVLTVEDIINAAPLPTAVEPVPQKAQVIPAAAASKYRYRAIVTRGDEVREVASTRLNEEIFGQIRNLAQTGDYDGAARLLCDHADIGVTEALEFVSMIEPNT
ncbi:hypothetical protein ACX80E_13290 [Arthrobacter sp. TMN-49]